MRHVLVVDDEPGLLKLYSVILKRAGFDVLLAKDGREALELIKQDTPDLIISDLMMPELDGMELCTMVRANARTRQVPFVLVTAITDPRVHRQALDCGANRVLKKPVMAQPLLQAVNGLLVQSTDLSGSSLPLTAA
jgi:CheY-like chemotaxis protein